MDCLITLTFFVLDQVRSITYLAILDGGNYFNVVLDDVINLYVLYKGMFIPPCEGMSWTETNPGQYEPLTQQVCLMKL